MIGLDIGLDIALQVKLSRNQIVQIKWRCLETEPKVDGDWYIDRLQQSHDRECNVLMDVRTNDAKKFKCQLVC